MIIFPRIQSRKLDFILKRTSSFPWKKHGDGITRRAFGAEAADERANQPNNNTWFR